VHLPFRRRQDKKKSVAERAQIPYLGEKPATVATAC
jgi:hypothetical protein